MNLGVYDGKTFIGIREKFGSRFLDSEDHWDTGAPHGTCYPLEDVGVLPDEIEALDSFGQVCKATGRPVEWDTGAGTLVYKDTREPLPTVVDSWEVKPNTALFEYLNALARRLT